MQLVVQGPLLEWKSSAPCARTNQTFHGVNDEAVFNIFGEGHLRSSIRRLSNNEYDYAQAKTVIAGDNATVWINGLECSLKGMSDDLENVDDAAMIRAGLGESVSVIRTE